MVEEKEIKQGLKCPFCPCIFLTQADLRSHLDCFGSGKQDHEERYRKTHVRIEHGSFGEE